MKTKKKENKEEKQTPPPTPSTSKPNKKRSNNIHYRSPSLPPFFFSLFTPRSSFVPPLFLFFLSFIIFSRFTHSSSLRLFFLGHTLSILPSLPPSPPLLSGSLSRHSFPFFSFACVVRLCSSCGLCDNPQPKKNTNKKNTSPPLRVMNLSVCVLKNVVLLFAPPASLDNEVRRERVAFFEGFFCNSRTFYSTRPAKCIGRTQRKGGGVRGAPGVLGSVECR